MNEKITWYCDKHDYTHSEHCKTQCDGCKKFDADNLRIMANFAGIFKTVEKLNKFDEAKKNLIMAIAKTFYLDKILNWLNKILN